MSVSPAADMGRLVELMEEDLLKHPPIVVEMCDEMRKALRNEKLADLRREITSGEFLTEYMP